MSKNPPIDSLVLHSPDDLEKLWSWAARLRGFWDWHKDAVVILAYESETNFRQRSLPQNNLYWEWLTTISKFFTGKKVRNENGSVKTLRITKDQAHDLMRHKFLGYENVRVGQTELQPRLRSTSALSSGEMSEYMYQIDAWAQDVQCLLPYPSDGEYQKYKEARQ